MPWNDQSGGGGERGPGPWGSGPQQRPPWGQPPRGPQRENGPDLEDMMRRWNERLRGWFGGSGGGGGRGGPQRLNWSTFAAGALVLWALTGIYIVDEGERGVVSRFGGYAYTSMPGLHWHLPLPLEDVRVIPVSSQRRIEVGTSDNQDSDESLMITGDRNIADIDFAVIYRLKDARAYLYNISAPDEAIRGVAESAMREIVGQRQLQAIITTDRAAVEAAVEQQLQAVMDGYGAGVEILQVQLLKAAPPTEVQDAFNEVVRAGQVAETTINQATQYANEQIPRARGDAARITQDAEAYREQMIREANGEAQRFSLVEQQYRAAPRVTRERLYLETMERVLSRADTVIVDRQSGAVPVLPLDQFRRNQPPATPAQPGATGPR